MSLDNLPVEWSVSQLTKMIASEGLISDGDWIESKDQDEKGDIRLIQLADIGDGDFRDKSNRYMNQDAFDRLNCVELKANDVLIARMPDPLGRACIFPKLPYKCVTVVDVCLIRTGEHSAISPKLLKYWINATQIRNLIALNATGTTRKRITRKKLESFDFPVPPLAEQQEIVRQLDTMLAQVEHIKARLDAIPAILKKFRQSVLESSFRNLSKVRKVFLKDLVLSIDQGWSPKCLNTPASEKQWGIIKTSAIQSLYFDANENKELPSSLEPREALTLKSGDVLITRAGPRSRCGVSCIVDKNYDNLMICDKVYRVRCDSKKILADYLNLYLNSLTGLSLIEKMKTGSSESGMNLTQSKFRDLQIPLINLEQQIAFASDIKFFFLLANQIEEENRSAQKRVNLLTQSILAKAFSGELTAEWREQHQELITGVNSAEALLVKIQAKREVSKPAKKTRKKSEA